VLALFLLLILLWVIGGQIQLDAGFAALFVMGLLFLPKIGVLPTSALKEINWDITLLIGTSVSIIGIFDQTGMIKVVSTALVAPVLNPLALYGVIGVALGVVIVNLIAHFMLPAPGNIPLAVPLLIGWGTQVAHLPALEVLVVLLLLSALVNQVVVLAYQMPPFYVFLGMEVTDHAKFNGLLVKIWPFATIGALLGALVAYGMVTSLGLSPGT
jgi:hypothetical protein